MYTDGHRDTRLVRHSPLYLGHFVVPGNGYRGCEFRTVGASRVIREGFLSCAEINAFGHITGALPINSAGEYACSNEAFQRVRRGSVSRAGERKECNSALLLQTRSSRGIKGAVFV